MIILCGSFNSKLMLLKIIFFPEIYSMFNLVIFLILNILFFIHKENSKISIDTFILLNTPSLQKKVHNPMYYELLLI